MKTDIHSHRQLYDKHRPAIGKNIRKTDAAWCTFDVLWQMLSKWPKRPTNRTNCLSQRYHRLSLRLIDVFGTMLKFAGGCGSEMSERSTLTCLFTSTGGWIERHTTQWFTRKIASILTWNSTIRLVAMAEAQLTVCVRFSSPIITTSLTSIIGQTAVI